MREALLQTQNQVFEIANGLNAVIQLIKPKEPQHFQEDNNLIDYVG